jgi:GAG-pre-integrase domain
MIKDTTTILKFHELNGLYVLRPHQEEANAFVVRKTLPKLVQWHLRLAHLNFGALKQAAKDGVVEGLQLSKSNLDQMYSCESCEVAKANRMSYKNTHPYRAQVHLERVHIDRSPRRPSVARPTTNLSTKRQDTSGGFYSSPSRRRWPTSKISKSMWSVTLATS